MDRFIRSIEHTEELIVINLMFKSAFSSPAHPTSQTGEKILTSERVKRQMFVELSIRGLAGIGPVLAEMVPPRLFSL